MEVLEEQFRIAIVSAEFKSIKKFLYYLNHNYKNRNERRLMPDICLGLAYIYWRTMRIVYWNKPSYYLFNFLGGKGQKILLRRFQNLIIYNIHARSKKI